MPKQKIRKSITKRFRITKNGKVLRRQSGKGHLNTGKSSKRKRRLGRVVQLEGKMAKKIKKYLGKEGRKRNAKN